MAHIIRLALAIYLLLPSSALFAHHGNFYKEVFAAIKTTDLEDIKDWFSCSAWDGKQGAMSAAELQERLKTARVRGLFENSLHDEQRSKCLVAFKLEYPDQTVEPIWLLAEDFDPRFREWDWRIVRIVNEERQAQAFFKHSYSAEFSAVGMEDAEATEPAVPSNRSSSSDTVPDPSSGVRAEEIVSGPQVGEPVTGFFDIDGEKRGGLKDRYPIGTVMRYYCEFRGLVVLVFARTFDDEMASLVKEIDKVIGDNPESEIGSYVNFMGDDVETLKAAATEFGEQHKINHVALVVLGEFQNPRQRMKMNVSPNAEVTVVIYELRPDRVVKANHALGPGSLNSQAIQAIIDDIERFKR